MLATKLGRLPSEAGHLLEVVAVSGQALSLEEAARTAGHELVPVATLTRMRNERLLRLVGTEERPLVDTYHDRVRETVLDQMKESTCKNIHRSLAEIIENGVGSDFVEIRARFESDAESTPTETKANPRAYDLAYHFDAAGEQRKAWAYGLFAAEQARRQSALEVAVQQYAIARRNASAANEAVRFRIEVGCGESQMLLGRYAEADDGLKKATQLSEQPEKRALVEVLQGEVAFKQGLINPSSAFCASGLRRLGHSVPRRFLGHLLRLPRQLIVQWWHSLLPGRLHRKASDSFRRVQIRLLAQICYPFFFQNAVKLMWAHLSTMNLAELLPPSSILNRAYAQHAVITGMLGWHSRAARYADRAIAVANDLNDVWGRAEGHSYLGISDYAGARFTNGLAHLSEAIEGYEKSGDLWELNLAHFHKGCCHFGLGDLAEAVAEARWTFAASARIGDSRTLCSSYLWAKATRGNLPFEEIRGCYPNRPDDVMSTAHGIMAEGQWHTFHGRTAEALDAFERAAAHIRRNLCLNSHMVWVIPMLTGALRRHGEAVSGEDAKQSRRLLRRAYRTGKWATRITRFFPAAYPFALRERSLILSRYGKKKKALRYAAKSCAVAEAQKAKYEHAQSLLVRGKLAKELGLPEADEQIRTAEAALEKIERPVCHGGQNASDQGT
jgi:two-component system sensor kinase